MKKNTAYPKNSVGAYGPYIEQLCGDGPRRLSFRQPKFKSLAAWKKLAYARAVECIAEPPADPCPDQGTAKHAASACCPLMSGTIALLPLSAVDGTSSSLESPLLTLAHRLTGLTFTQDPPPPRV